MTTDPAETRSPSALLSECAAMLDEMERVERAATKAVRNVQALAQEQRSVPLRHGGM